MWEARELLSLVTAHADVLDNTHYSDVGAFQFYGIGVDNMVVGMSMERGGGFAAWSWI